MIPGHFQNHNNLPTTPSLQQPINTLRCHTAVAWMVSTYLLVQWLESGAGLVPGYNANKTTQTPPFSAASHFHCLSSLLGFLRLLFPALTALPG
jgi:hypothetical protein